jgi:hypothetical protein
MHGLTINIKLVYTQSNMYNNQDILFIVWMKENNIYKRSNSLL